VAIRLKHIKEFIESRMEAIGNRHKAVALATIHAEGYPEYLGPRTIEEVGFVRPQLCRIATMETLRSGRSVHFDGDATPSGWESPIRGRSPPRGRSMERRGRSREGSVRMAEESTGRALQVMEAGTEEAGVELVAL
jgi:hypothetical protein